MKKHEGTNLAHAPPSELTFWVLRLLRLQRAVLLVLAQVSRVRWCAYGTCHVHTRTGLPENNMEVEDPQFANGSSSSSRSSSRSRSSSSKQQEEE